MRGRTNSKKPIFRQAIDIPKIFPYFVYGLKQRKYDSRTQKFEVQKIFVFSEMLYWMEQLHEEYLLGTNPNPSAIKNG